MNKFESVTIDLESFHPSFRDGMRSELDALLAETPPFGEGKLHICADKTYCNEYLPGKMRKESMDQNGYALTSRNPTTNEGKITFSGFLYGNDGDIAKMECYRREDHKRKFHGSMTNWRADLAHEYGHYILGCMHHVFLNEDTDKDKRITRAWEHLNRDCWGGIVVDGSNPFGRLLIESGANRSPRKDLVSGYAKVNDDEFFAETFAARRWANEEDRRLPSVAAMNSLLRITYERVNEMGIAYHV